MYLLC